MTRAAVYLYGHARLTVSAPDGTVTARAEARNMVLNGGLRLLSLIITGRAMRPRLGAIVGIDGMESEPDMTIIKNPDGWKPAPATGLTVDGTQVAFSAVFEPAATDTEIREAGVELTVDIDDTEVTRLYNRAVVDPGLPVRSGEVLTVNWTITFAPAQA